MILCSGHYSEYFPCFVMDFGVRMLDRKNLNLCTPFFAVSQCDVLVLFVVCASHTSHGFALQPIPVLSFSAPNPQIREQFYYSYKGSSNSPYGFTNPNNVRIRVGGWFH